MATPELQRVDSLRARGVFTLQQLGDSVRSILSNEETNKKNVPHDEEAIRQTRSEAFKKSGEAAKEADELALLPLPQLLDNFGVDAVRGLSAAEVETRVATHGLNALDKAEPTPWWRLYLEQFTDLLVILLIIACIVSFALEEYPAATTIFIIVQLNALIGVVQEAKASKALDALQDLSKDRTEVLRNSEVIIVDSENLVPGDVVQITTGQKIPADMRLLQSHSLILSEMALTGESAGVSKDSEWLPGKSGGDEHGGEKKLTPSNMVFMGCSVLDGRGRAVVVKTGMQTRMGNIAKLLNQADSGLTPLQLKLQKLGVKLGIYAIIAATVVYIIGVAYDRKPDVTSDQPSALQMLLVSVSLIVAAVPEGLPAAVTITLAVGMKRMVTKNAIIRKLHSVETLGSATVICSDKTGTLTAGVMTATRLWFDGAVFKITGKAYNPVGEFIRTDTDQKVQLNAGSAPATVLLAAALCSNASLKKGEGNEEWECIGNTSERPLVVAAAKVDMWMDKLQQQYVRIKENPFSSVRKMMSVLIKSDPAQPGRFPDSPKFLAVVKGAPNIVLAKCHSMLSNGGKDQLALEPLNEKSKERILGVIDDFSGEALRVLAIAYQPIAGDSPPPNDDPETLENNLILCGLIASIDPERDEVIPSIEAAHCAGIRVVMITGDYVKTAKAIAENINLIPKNAGKDSAIDCEVVRNLGDEIDKLDAALKDTSGHGRKKIEADLEAVWNRLDEVTCRADVYARAKPEDKITIVKSLQRQGNVCSMTGDGVNDAPALKQADIGVAMGITGTDVAKASADMVLTTDNFVSIVDAIEEGRTIYANISKFVFFLLSNNISEVMLVLLSIMFGLPTPLSAVQILWLNLTTDGAPAVALAVEVTEPGIMKMGPRPKSEPIIEKLMITGIIIQTIVLTTSNLVIYLIGLKWNTGNWQGDRLVGVSNEDYKDQVNTARTMVILMIVFQELLRAHTCRSLRASVFTMGLFTNIYMHLSVTVAACVSLAFALIKPMQKLFDMRDLAGREWALILCVALIPAIVEETTKFVYRRTGYGARPTGVRYFRKETMNDGAVKVEMQPAAKVES